MTAVRFFSLPKPGELVRFLVTTNIMLFVTALLIAPEAVNYTLSPSVFLSPATNVLFKLGASGTLPVFADDRWWTLITANYLHGSLLHIVFNVSSLRSIGNITIPIYGPTRLFLIYFAGGIAAMGASSLAGIPLTLGASGAICALIGPKFYDDLPAKQGQPQDAHCFGGRVGRIYCTDRPDAAERQQLGARHWLCQRFFAGYVRVAAYHRKG